MTCIVGLEYSEDVQAYGELPDREAIQDAKEAIVNQRRKQL